MRSLSATIDPQMAQLVKIYCTEEFITVRRPLAVLMKGSLHF